MQYTARPSKTIITSATTQLLHSRINFAYVRILTALFLLAAMALTVMLNAQPIHAEELCASRGCVLACISTSKVCSLFPSKSVPGGYAKVSYMPFGYRRVRQSSCDKMVCPTFSTTCRRWIPTGKNAYTAP